MSRSAISHTRVRELLSEAAGGARVMEEAVLRVVAELDERLEWLVRETAERFTQERDARTAQGLRPIGLVRGDHVPIDSEGEAVGSAEVA